MNHDLAARGRIFLKEFDAFWSDPLHMKHPDAEAYSYLRAARDAFEASLGPAALSTSQRGETPMRCRWCGELHYGGPENCGKPDAKPTAALCTNNGGDQ